MSRVATTVKKHLDFESLRESLSTSLLNISDHRQVSSCSHSLHDAVMSAFACMFFRTLRCQSFSAA